MEKNLFKKLVLFTFPLIMSGLLQQMFNWIDALMVGNIIGENALAAVGATSILHTFGITLLVGFTSGLSILFAQSYGYGDQDKIKKVFSSYLIVLVLLFSIFAFAGVLNCEKILLLLDTPYVLMEEAKSYGIVVFLGIPFLALYNIYASLLKGIGNSKIPFYAVLVSSIMNVLLDYVFVAIFSYGVKGAAYATLFSQIVMAIYIVFYFNYAHKDLRVRVFKEVNISALKEGCKYGFPPSIQSGIFSLGNIFLQRFLNGFGEHALAAITTAYRIDSIILLPLINFGTGVSTLVAQSIGSDNKEEARKIMKLGLYIMIPLSLCLTLIVYIFGESLIRLFGLTSVSVLIGKQFFNTLSSFYIVCAIYTVIRGYLEGCTDLIFTGTMGVLALLVRIVSSYLFKNVFGIMVVAYAEAFSWLFLLAIYSLRYIYKRKHS